ncbi:MAG: 1-acyl-sn-glycerol-3-phosphate acyltransferase [Gemmatimonadaceae bacterium]|nr:1-acyl-sn-glycerol-3-phosphate acyltransferase [Acetobacteraceae bacterium]
MTDIRSAVIAAYGWVAFIGVLTILAFNFLVSSAIAAVLALVLPRRVRAPLGRWVIQHGFRLNLGIMRATGLCRVDVAALAGLRQARGVVVTPNHPSLLDVMLIVSCLPNAVCITKAALWNNPLLGGTARLAGYIRNDAPLKLVRRATAELRAGSNLLIFPEGTRTTDSTAPLGRFRPGFALMAKAAGAPIQVVFIEADTPYLRKGWPVWRKPPLPMAFRARLGGQHEVTGSIEPYVDALEAQMRAALVR